MSQACWQKGKGLWLRCDCRGDTCDRPLVAPCLTASGGYHWRVLRIGPLPHDEQCVFYRAYVRRKDPEWDRPARKRPSGFFGVDLDPVEGRGLSARGEPGTEDREGGQPGPPAMRQQLLLLMERAGLNRLSQVDLVEASGRWLHLMGERSELWSNLVYG